MSAGLRRLGGVIREALAAAASSPIASIATIIMVAGLCATVLLTTGRTVGAEQAVLGSIDSAGTRTTIVRAEPAAGLTSSVVTRLSTVDGIEWVAAFGPAFDVTNTLIPDGTKVAARFAYGAHLTSIGIPESSALPGSTAWGTALSLGQLGLVDHAGSVTNQSGANYPVAGQMDIPDWLGFLEPALFVPRAPVEPEPVAVLVVVAERPDLVAAVAPAVQSLLAVDDPTKITITTSEALAQLRALVQGQLGAFGRGLVLLILAVSGLLVAAILTGLVTLRRKDFGRRRALGATRGLIVSILLTQTLVLATLGAALGSGVASMVLAFSGDPLPGLAFTAAIAVLAIAVSVVAALIPAVVAARRDPIRELRVP